MSILAGEAEETSRDGHRDDSFMTGFQWRGYYVGDAAHRGYRRGELRRRRKTRGYRHCERQSEGRTQGANSQQRDKAAQRR